MKKFLFVIACFIVFIIPFEVWVFSTNQVVGIKMCYVLAIDALANGLLFLTFGIVLSMLSKRLAVFYSHLYFVFTYLLVLGIVVLHYLLHIPFSLLVLNALFDTTVAESLEFLTVQLNLFNLGVLLLIITVLFFVYRNFLDSSKDLYSRPNRTKLKIVVPIILFYSICIYQNDLLYSNNMVNELQDAYHQYKQGKDLLREEKNYSYLSIAKEVDCYNASVDTNGKTIVLIIGESLSRHHMSLYGYQRKTNPLLEGIRSELVLFKNVISPAQTTILSLQKMLSFGSLDHPDYLYSKPTLLDVFNKAGYKTYWISNQQVSGIQDTWSKVYAQKADKSIFVNNTNSWLHYSFDENVIPHLEEAMKDTAKCKLIIIHLLGSHMRYDKRYTSEFDRFSKSEHFPLIFKDAGSQEKNLINLYDNSVLYNDYVIFKCINTLKLSESNVCMVYVSDHGEAVCEESEYCGHNGSAYSKFMLEVPFIYWDNKSKESDTDLNAFCNRSFQADQLMNSLLDIADIRTTMFDSSKSIFSNYFVPSKRYIHELDYDSLYSIN